MDHPGLQQCK